MRSRCVYIATLFGALAAPAIVVASERVDICAQYSATGDSYHVAAISTNGSELNEATNTPNYDIKYCLASNCTQSSAWRRQ
jgi:hypothetical protein